MVATAATNRKPLFQRQNSSFLLSRLSSKHAATVAPQQQQQQPDFKLKDAHHRLETSVDALMSYLAHQGGVNPRALGELKAETLVDQPAILQHRDGSFYAQRVEALGKLQQYAECLLSTGSDDDDNSSNDDNQQQQRQRLLLMTAWAALSRYLQLIQRGLERWQIQALLLQHAEEEKQRQRMPSASSGASSSRHSLIQLGEAIVSCEKEWILLNRRIKQ